MPSVSIGGTFEYLGKLYDFNMKNAPAKSMLIQKVNDLLTTSNLKIQVQLKLKILNYIKILNYKYSKHS